MTQVSRTNKSLKRVKQWKKIKKTSQHKNKPKFIDPSEEEEIPKKASSDKKRLLQRQEKRHQRHQSLLTSSDGKKAARMAGKKLKRPHSPKKHQSH